MSFTQIQENRIHIIQELTIMMTLAINHQHYEIFVVVLIHQVALIQRLVVAAYHQ